jgi:hypothetical protein
MRRAVTRVIRQVGCRRGCVTADRGCAAVALCTLLTASGVACVLRVKQSTKLALAGGQTLYPLRFPGTTRRRPLGQGLEWAGAPPPLWGTMRRQREWQGTWGHWYVGRQAGLCSGASRGGSGLAPLRNGGWAVPTPGSSSAPRGRGCWPSGPSRGAWWGVWRPGGWCRGPHRRVLGGDAWSRAAVGAVRCAWSVP